MSDKNEAYSIAKSGKLKLKGEGSSKKDKHKKSKKRKAEDIKVDSQLEDELSHAGGWCVENFQQVTGTVFIEFKEFMYCHALDNGLFVLGAAHSSGEPPEQSELLTAIRIDDRYISFKSAYGKYLNVNSHGLVIGRSDAISPKEYFELEFDYDYDGRKIYLKASNGKYVSVNHEGDIVAMSEDKAECELRIRSLAKRDANKSKNDLPTEEQADDLKNVEINYVKKFQKFQDKKIRLNKEDTKELEAAKEIGVLHEKMLDRREKMKSDRYCK